MRSSRERTLARMLSIIRKNPDGIRPSRLNKLLGLKHSADLRNTLLEKGLLRKVRKGNAVYYYAR